MGEQNPVASEDQYELYPIFGRNRLTDPGTVATQHANSDLFVVRQGNGHAGGQQRNQFQAAAPGGAQDTMCVEQVNGNAQLFYIMGG